MVEAAIHGQSDRLKERQIGIEVFHRKPNYDNTSDPVVRVAAGEVRKRLAQYYGDPENAGQLRISLPVGSYVPFFHVPEDVKSGSDSSEGTAPAVGSINPSAIAGSNADPDAAAKPVESQQVLDSPPKTGSLRVWLAFAAVLILAAATLGTWRMLAGAHRAAGFDAFWSPILNSQDELLISVGALRARDVTFVPDPQRNGNPDTSETKLEIEPSQGVTVQRLEYLQAVARIAAVLGGEHRAFDVRDQFGTSFDDFRRPMILVGSFDNDWATGVSAGGRFKLMADYARKLQWIEDAKKPGVKIGALDLAAPQPATHVVYSIVMREFGQVSHQPRVVLAGIGDKGTIAAAEFASNPKYLNDFAQHAPKDLAYKNVEFLLETRVVENVAGIPTIVDYSVW